LSAIDHRPPFRSLLHRLWRKPDQRLVPRRLQSLLRCLHRPPMWPCQTQYRRSHMLPVLASLVRLQ
jgi:hypothetical protein